MIRFRCRQCGLALQAEDSASGKEARCSRCSALITVPSRSSSKGSVSPDVEPDLETETLDEPSSADTDVLPAIEAPAGSLRTEVPWAERLKKTRRAGASRSASGRSRRNTWAWVLTAIVVLLLASAAVYWLAMRDGN